MDTVNFLKQKINLIQDLEIRGAVLDLIDLHEANSKRPFDKLKELWDEWGGKSFGQFEDAIANRFSIPTPYTQSTIHVWLAEHCGFPTAEVRQAIQQLKSSELIHKSSDDMRNEDY